METVPSQFDMHTEGEKFIAYRRKLSYLNCDGNPATMYVIEGLFAEAVVKISSAVARSTTFSGIPEMFYGREATCLWRDYWGSVEDVNAKVTSTRLSQGELVHL